MRHVTVNPLVLIKLIICNPCKKETQYKEYLNECKSYKSKCCSMPFKSYILQQKLSFLPGSLSLSRSLFCSPSLSLYPTLSLSLTHTHTHYAQHTHTMHNTHTHTMHNTHTPTHTHTHTHTHYAQHTHTHTHYAHTTSTSHNDKISTFSINLLRSSKAREMFLLVSLLRCSIDLSIPTMPGLWRGNWTKKKIKQSNICLQYVKHIFTVIS